MRAVDSGKPRLWLNYEAPFAELPPIFMPPEPVLVRAGSRLIFREFSENRPHAPQLRAAATLHALCLLCQGVCNGPEPQPEDFVVDASALESIPEFELPPERALPTWSPPTLKASVVPQHQLGTCPRSPRVPAHVGSACRCPSACRCRPFARPVSRRPWASCVARRPF